VEFSSPLTSSLSKPASESVDDVDEDELDEGRVICGWGMTMALLSQTGWRCYALIGGSRTGSNGGKLPSIL
jgi:hypothetical protein